MLKFLAKSFLRLTGWQAEGQRPVPERYVLIAAPHTSNWDLAYLLAFAAIFDVKMRFMAKHQLFWGPFGPIMRKLGGIPVRRDRKGDLVQEMADFLRDNDGVALTVPAEGTRAYVPHWKSGFYHIARAAEVPIVPSYLDYARKRAASARRSYPRATSARTWTRSAHSMPTRKDSTPSSSGRCG